MDPVWIASTLFYKAVLMCEQAGLWKHMTCLQLFTRDQQSWSFGAKVCSPFSWSLCPPCAPDKRSLIHSSPHWSQFIFISESHRLVVYINILPYWIPFNKTAMWVEKRSWQFLNYLLSVLYLLAVTWEGLRLLPTTHTPPSEEFSTRLCLSLLLHS